MRNILYYPIGLSDIKLFGKERAPEFREDTMLALSIVSENPDELFDDSIVQFPVIKAVAAYLKRNNIRLHRLILIATDQPETVPLSTKDTINAAKLLTLFAPSLDILNGGAECIETRIIRNKPQDYDTMFEYFHELVRQAETGPSVRHIVNASTGTPAMTGGLIHAFSHFPGRFEMLYTPQGADIAHPIRAAHGLRLERWKHTIQALVSEYHYSSAATVVRQSGVFQDASVPILLDGMSHLDNFRFEKARKCFNDYQTKGRSLNAEQAREFGKLMNFAMQTASDDKNGRTSGELLQLLAAVINTRYSTGRITEALALLARLDEAVLIHVINNECRIKVSSVDRDFDPFFKQLQSNAGLWARLTRKGGALGKKPLPTKPNKKLYAEIASYYLESGATSEIGKHRIKSALDTLTMQLDKENLQMERNRGPYAHWFTGAHETKALREIIASLAAFLPSYLGAAPYDPFDNANHILLELIQTMD